MKKKMLNNNKISTTTKKNKVKRSNSLPSSSTTTTTTMLRSNYLENQYQYDNDDNDCDDDDDDYDFDINDNNNNYTKYIIDDDEEKLKNLIVSNETYYDRYRHGIINDDNNHHQLINNNYNQSFNQQKQQHRHSFHYPNNYYENPDFINFTATTNKSSSTTTTTTTITSSLWTATLAIISVQHTTTILFIQWILYPFNSFIEYIQLLFNIINNLLITLLQFYLMIIIFSLNYLGFGHLSSILIQYLTYSKFIWQPINNNNKNNLRFNNNNNNNLYSLINQLQTSFHTNQTGGTINLNQSNTGNILFNFFKSANQLSPDSTIETCQCCNIYDQQQQQQKHQIQRQRSISLDYPTTSSSSSYWQQSDSKLKRHHSQIRCNQIYDNKYCHKHHHNYDDHHRQDLFDALHSKSPTLLNFLIKPIIQTFFDWSQLNKIISVARRMKNRVRKTFRWCPTSSEELDEAEFKVLSYLKCNYQTYYVDIGSRWDLDHVKIWTMEIEPDSMNAMNNNDDDQQGTTPPDLLPQIVGLRNQNYLSEQGLPLVMIHGFASGIGLWALNMDELAKRGNRRIFAFDLLGFAKSSRPCFPSSRFSRNLTSAQKIKAEAEQIESYYVECLEKWRQSIGEPLANKFIILGHSFGAYIAMAYALKHPSHVAHVILADAWGIPPETQSRHLAASGRITTRQLPWWAKLIGRMFLDIFNPLSLLRAIGPWGPVVLNSTRADIKYKFERLTKGENYCTWKRFSAAEQAEHPPPLESGDELSSDENEDSIDGGQLNDNDKHIKSTKNKDKNTQCDFLNYIYHCNAQSRPSGEIAFKKLCSSTGWARLPILDRIQDLDSRITLTFIYGSRSWIDRQTGLQAKYILATKSLDNNNVFIPQNNNNARINSNEDINNNNNNNDLFDRQQQKLSTSSTTNLDRVEIHVIQGAGHHIYADKPQEFNELILTISHQIDQLFISNKRRISNNNNDDDVNIQQQQPLININNQNNNQQQQQQEPKIRPGRKYGNYLRPPKFLSSNNNNEINNNNNQQNNLNNDN